MDKRENTGHRGKSPLLAAILSFFIPGSGFFYLGLIGRGIVYMIVLAALIIALVNVSEYNARAPEIVVMSLMLGGFYIFQVVDSFNAARGRRATRAFEGAQSNPEVETPSLFGSILILVLGILFQLNNLDILAFSQIVRLWPLLLIALGVHIMLSQQSARKGGEK